MNAPTTSPAPSARAEWFVDAEGRPLRPVPVFVTSTSRQVAAEAITRARERRDAMIGCGNLAHQPAWATFDDAATYAASVAAGLLLADARDVTATLLAQARVWAETFGLLQARASRARRRAIAALAADVAATARERAA